MHTISLIELTLLGAFTQLPALSVKCDMSLNVKYDSNAK